MLEVPNLTNQMLEKSYLLQQTLLVLYDLVSLLPQLFQLLLHAI